MQKFAKTFFQWSIAFAATCKIAFYKFKPDHGRKHSRYLFYNWYYRVTHKGWDFKDDFTEYIRFKDDCTEYIRFKDDCTEYIRFKDDCTEYIRFNDDCTEYIRFKDDCTEYIRFKDDCTECTLHDPNRYKDLPVLNTSFHSYRPV